MAMQKYKVLIEDESSCLFWFECQADDGDHAEEQAQNAYPGTRVVVQSEGKSKCVCKELNEYDLETIMLALRTQGSSVQPDSPWRHRMARLWNRLSAIEEWNI